MTRVSILILFSSAKLSMFSLAAAHHNCVGLTHRGFVACPLFRLTYGEGAFIFTFSTASHLFGGAASHQYLSTPPQCFFRVFVTNYSSIDLVNVIYIYQCLYVLLLAAVNGDDKTDEMEVRVLGG